MSNAKYFRLEELVHPEILTARGDRAWELLDPRAVQILDRLRERYGPTVCNTWHQGGNASNRGLRPFDSSIGARWSQHKYGRAFDVHFKDISVQEVYADLLDTEGHLGIRVLEDIKFTPTWLHFDMRWTGRDGVWIVRP